MKKNLLLALVFVSLTGFNNVEVKAPSVESIISKRIPVSCAPTIIERYPSGKIIRDVGREVYFFIDYNAYPRPEVVVLKDGKTIVNSIEYEIQHINLTDHGSVIVTIYEAKLKDAGKYEIKLINPLGEASATFIVEITDKEI